MYQLINNNIHLLLRGVDRQQHVAPYIAIRDKFNNKENDTADFKSIYRKFYQLNAARLSEEFCNSYFDLLQKNRDNEELNIENIVNSLYEIECNSKGTHAVHFSFATKLAHTINNGLPVYDSMVAAFYFFPEIKSNWDKKRKVQEYLSSYQFLRNEYSRVIENNLLAISIKSFRELFEVGEEYSNIKIIDTLLWRYTAFLKSGAIRNDHIQYG